MPVNEHRLVRLLVCTVVLGAAWAVAGADGLSEPVPGHAGEHRRTGLTPFSERETLTDDWFGLGEGMRDAGITTTLNLWLIYQANVTGGLDTDQDLTGAYRFDNDLDLDRLADLDGASAFARIEGGWNDGVNDAVGAIMNVNAMQDGGRAIGVTHLWFQQNFLDDDRVRLRVGKLDSSVDAFEFHDTAVAFDAMPYANFEGTMFVNGGLVNNAAIPFPESALGIQLFVEPVERLYVAASVTQANGNAFGIEFSDLGWTVLVESGLVVELGDVALPGQYFVGYFGSDVEDAPFTSGVYFGAAQLVVREAGTKDEGIGVFARYGHADGVSSGIRHFWSLGGQYQGLFPGRDEDVLGVGWAQSFTRGDAFTAPYEGVLEGYYRARITPWCALSPHVQYIANPGSNDIDDAVTLGLRAQITF